VLRSFPIRLPVVNGLGQDVDYDQGLEWRSFVEPMTSALVEANLNILAEEEELKPLPRNVENLADDPSLQNPLERLERMGTGWFGVILDFEGVVVQGEYGSHVKAWLQLAEEENRPLPLQSSLKRATAMKAEQVTIESILALIGRRPFLKCSVGGGIRLMCVAWPFVRRKYSRN